MRIDMKNELFKKLATLAGADFESFSPYDNFDPEEFARLIVQTCIDLADDKYAYGVMDHIIDHFGMEG